MIESARRVAFLLVIGSFFTLGYATFLTGSPLCSGFGECGAALSLYTLDMSAPQSTPPAAVQPQDDYGFTNQVIQLVSLYALITGLSLLISLEFTKPHYIKRTKKSTKRRRAA